MNNQTTTEALRKEIVKLVRPFCVHSYERGTLLSIAEEEMYDEIMQLIQQEKKAILEAVALITDEMGAKRIANINEKYMGTRDCKMCGQNPEEWRSKLLQNLAHSQEDREGKEGGE